MLDNVYTSIASAITAEVPKFLNATTTIIGVIAGFGLALYLWKRGKKA